MKSAIAALRGARLGANRFGRSEWAGAFGDLGTLIPFLLAYINLLDLDPTGVLVAFGLAKIAAGLFYKTPFPVQPMKAIGAISTTQSAQATVITPDMVYASGLVTGLVWLLLGVTGVAQRLAVLVGRPVALGIVLGLGFSFMLDGIKLMSASWLLAAPAFALTMLLMKSRRIPAMFVLLLLGAAAACVKDPGLLSRLAALELAPRLPALTLLQLDWKDMVAGSLLLALPQLPLTLGNAVIAITQENNRLFPDRPVSERQVAISTGIMNLLGASIGGVPMCHGAGGMAGHVAFGARTGGALVILGTILLTMGLFYSQSVSTLFAIFPSPVLGVFLLITGSQLALGTSSAHASSKEEYFIIITTAAFSVWNVGIAFFYGLAMHHLLKLGRLRV